MRQLNAFAIGDCVPDITFLLDIDLETARSRMQQPRRPDRMEQQANEFYERVRDGYQELAREHRDRIALIEGWQSLQDIEKQIWETLVKRFPELAAKSEIENPKSKM